MKCHGYTDTPTKNHHIEGFTTSIPSIKHNHSSGGDDHDKCQVMFIADLHIEPFFSETMVWYWFGGHQNKSKPKHCLNDDLMYYYTSTDTQWKMPDSTLLSENKTLYSEP